MITTLTAIQGNFRNNKFGNIIQTSTQQSQYTSKLNPLARQPQLNTLTLSFPVLEGF
jgi:hypothetical protein